MNNMCCGAINFNQPLSNFDTSNVTTMYSMFFGAENFNQSLENIDTSNVTNMSYMFNNAARFNQPLDGFNTHKVHYMDSMFEGATSMFIGYIMRFVANAIFIYNNYDAMKIENNQYTDSIEFDLYIIRLHNIKNNTLINSALDGFIVDC